MRGGGIMDLYLKKFFLTPPTMHYFTLPSFRAKSFTLIELLIVIVIIGILAVSLVPRIRGTQEQAKYVAMKTHFHKLLTQAEIYYMDYQTYGGVCADSTIASIISDIESL